VAGRATAMVTRRNAVVQAVIETRTVGPAMRWGVGSAAVHVVVVPPTMRRRAVGQVLAVAAWICFRTAGKTVAVAVAVGATRKTEVSGRKGGKASAFRRCPRCRLSSRPALRTIYSHSTALYDLK